MEIKLTKAKPSFYLMYKHAETKTVFKFLDAQLLVNRGRPSPSLLLAHNIALEKCALARYNLGSLPIRYVAALRHAIWHGNNQRQS